MGITKQTTLKANKMNALSKIAFAAALATSASAVMNPFQNGEAHYRGACLARDADGKKLGPIVFHQEDTGDADEAAVTFSARVKGAAANRVTFELSEEDPQDDDFEDDDVIDNFGDYRPNRRNITRATQLYINDQHSLQGDDDSNIDGKFVALRCT